MKATRLWVALLAVQAPVWAQSFTITTPCPAPQGTVGVYYELQLESANGKTPVRYAYMDGLLPPGLTFTQGGSLYGTPAAQGTLNFTIRATDDNNTTVTKNCSITMQPSSPNPLQILTACPIQAPSNQSFSTMLMAGGGLPPYVWTLALGSLPQGFFLGASNGVISGTTAQNGTFRFVLNVNDNSSQRAVKECTMATSPGGGQSISAVVDRSVAGSGGLGCAVDDSERQRLQHQHQRRLELWRAKPDRADDLFRGRGDSPCRCTGRAAGGRRPVSCGGAARRVDGV